MKTPKIISYRNYKSFSQLKFRKEVDLSLPGCKIVNISNDEFVSTFMHILNKSAPLKLKYIRANDSPFTTKDLRKAIMLQNCEINSIRREQLHLA